MLLQPFYLPVLLYLLMLHRLRCQLAKAKTNLFVIFKHHDPLCSLVTPQGRLIIGHCYCFLYHSFYLFYHCSCSFYHYFCLFYHCFHFSYHCSFFSIISPCPWSSYHQSLLLSLLSPIIAPAPLCSLFLPSILILSPVPPRLSTASQYMSVYQSLSPLLSVYQSLFPLARRPLQSPATS